MISKEKKIKWLLVITIKKPNHFKEIWLFELEHVLSTTRITLHGNRKARMKTKSLVL